MKTIGRMNRLWLAGAAGAEVLTYLWLSLVLRMLAGSRVNARRAAPARTALVLFGLGNLLPAAPAEGLVMAGAALKRRHLDPQRIHALLGCSQWFNNRALLAIGAVDVLVAVAVGDIPRRYEDGVVSGALVMLALLLLTAWLSLRRATAERVACVILRLRHPRNCPSRAVRRERGATWHRVALHVTGNRKHRVLLAGLNATAWVCDGLCMYLALRASGVRLEADQVMLAYTAGVIASKAPLVPAGLGVVETVTPLLLIHYGVPWSHAIAAVLVYRLFSTLVPAVAGTLAVLGFRLGPRARSEAADSARRWVQGSPPRPRRRWLAHR